MAEIDLNMKVGISIILLISLGIGFLYLNKSKYADAVLADKYFQNQGSYVVKNEEDAQQARKDAQNFSFANKIFKEGKYREALPMYNSLRFSKSYNHYAEWNLLMCRLKNDEPDDHVKLLNRIVNNPKHKMHQKALALNEDLNIFYRKLP